MSRCQPTHSQPYTLVLDDLFSELDQEKIINILKLLNRNVQTFITTTDIENIPDYIKHDSRIYLVDDGIVREEKNGK